MQIKAKKILLSVLAKQHRSSLEDTTILANESSITEKILQLKLIQSLINGLTSHRLRQTAIYYLKFSSHYYISPNEEPHILDYLHYTINNDPIIPFNYYSEKDRYEILRFLTNIYLLSVNNSFSIKKLFNKNDFRHWEKYDLLRKRVRKNLLLGYIAIDNFKSYHPFLNENIIAERSGLNKLLTRNKLKGSIVFDCGSCHGDSTWQLNYDLKPKLVVSIEPMKNLYQQLLRNIRLNRIINVLPLNIGVGDKITTAHMTNKGGMSSISEKGVLVKIDTIDNIVNRENLGHIGLIKMDIEGYEYNALIGARETIKRHKPALIIAIYHKGRDFFEIPKLIKEMVPSYKLRFANLKKDSPILERYIIAEV